LPYRLVITDTKPSEELQSAVKEKSNIVLHDDLSPDQILKYIREAQCNVLPTFQSTGIKLKLLSALFAGRFCIVNTPMVENTGLESLCIIADSPTAMKDEIRKTFAADFSSDEIAKREKILMMNFSNKINA